MGITPLHITAAKGRIAIMRVLLRHGADISKKKHSKENTPLHLAAKFGQSHAASVLCKQGFIYNRHHSEHNFEILAKNNQNRTPER